MPTFKDTKGNGWPIEPLTIGTVLRVKTASEGKFDLLEPMKPFRSQPTNGEPATADPTQAETLLQVLQFDFLEFWEMLGHLLAPEIEKRGMTLDSFGEVLAGDGLVQAQTIFFREWTSFFRQLRRLDVATAMEKLTQYMEKAIEGVKARMAAPEMAAMDATVGRKIDSILNKSFGDLQASLESIPDR